VRKPNPLPNPSPEGRGAHQSESVGRLRWRCRRGTRELDALLSWFLEERFPSAVASEQSGFARLLEEQDPDVWDWCMGRATPADADMRAVIDAIRARHLL